MHTLLPNIDIRFDLSSLADAIERQKGVVYTGAGTSIPVGLPGWDRFLDECLVRGMQSMSPPPANENAFAQARLLMEEGDYLTSAGILQHVLGQVLEQYVWDKFGEANQPSPIHYAISRIPFSLAITTNYDRLLESAYKCRPNVWTWRDPEALFSAIKHRRFSVVKIHGDVGNGPSLVLTKNQYRDLMHLNRAFNECLASLLSLRTFLFIGSSLKDRDLLQLMDTAKLTYGADFGPHYAVAFADEVDESLARLLKDSYNIHCVICREPDDDQLKAADWRTLSVCSFLKTLSGLVAKRVSGSSRLSMLENPAFNLVESADELLQSCVMRTGSDRGQIAFVKAPHLPALYSTGIYPSQRQRGPGHFGEEESHIPPDSFVGSAFVSPKTDGEYTYLPAIHESPGYRSGKRYCHSDTKSVMAYQITADGNKVGVMCVESQSSDAYSEGHRSAMKLAADAAGALYVEYRHRTKLVSGIRPFIEDMKTFQSVMDTSRKLRPLKLSYLLYDIDYGNGRIVAHFDSDLVTTSGEPRSGADHFFYSFHSKSLAARVLRERTTYLEREPRKAVDEGFVSGDGLDYFQIKGPVFACPVRVAGLTSAVLVCWSREGKDLSSETERIARLANLVANSSDSDSGVAAKKRSASRFMEVLNRNLAKADNNEDWTIEQLKDPVFRETIITGALKTLLHDSCGIRRVRRWQRTPKSTDPIHFSIIRSFNHGRSTTDNDYVGIETDSNDLCCRYTVDRSNESPYAQFQHFELFGKADENAKELHKDPEGEWLVAPIIYHGEIVGFLSADNHSIRQGKPKANEVSEEVGEFQRCSLDLIADLLSPIVALGFKRNPRSQPAPNPVSIRKEKAKRKPKSRKKTKRKRSSQKKREPKTSSKGKTNS